MRACVCTMGTTCIHDIGMDGRHGSWYFPRHRHSEHQGERGRARARNWRERQRARGIERENPRADKCDDTHTPAGCYTTTSDDTELNQTNRCDSTHTSRVLDDQVAARAPLPRY